MDTKKKVKLINRIVKEYYYRQLERQQEIKTTFGPGPLFIRPSVEEISDLRKWIGQK